ncbi:hypothetical protein PHPI107946_02520 [Phocicoccus pinnipedialis]|uniref:Uncharacterized protein n=1 Tax=Phocicoccus pinnipedialis TaxID=110845 RepID=A0A6V7RCW9_9BACL|nr:hypothetical protein [Jeotgalicoccus pinnipedialis]CAD2075273.1 hypothetical protein JEOPIN946_00970 [Jeotgalicoccus pinnipedialis]
MGFDMYKLATVVIVFAAIMFIAGIMYLAFFV